MHQNAFGGPLAYSAPPPDLLAELRGGSGKGEGWREGREGKREGEEGKGRIPQCLKCV